MFNIFQPTAQCNSFSKPTSGEFRPASDRVHQDGGRLADLQPDHPLRAHRYSHIHGHT